MSRMVIDGIGIEYELLGEPSRPVVVITPGGRYTKTLEGLRELGEALVAGGKQVLLWDRPNCGMSDISFDADSESDLNARTLIGLLRELDVGPATLVGGSAGARVSMIAASRAPDLVSHLVVFWVTGGAIGLMFLATYYCGDAANLAALEGMQAVEKAPAWAEQMKINPRARASILAQDPKTFISKMQQWAADFRPPDDSPVPGMTPASFAKLSMPVLILQNGSSDVPHLRETTEQLHQLIPNSILMDPPWPDDEWNIRNREVVAGRTASLCTNWHSLAPIILGFAS